MTEHHRWQLAGAAAGGFAAGGVVLRIDDVYQWLRQADWSSLPAATVGAAVPAVAGVVLATRIASRSIKSLKRSELEAEQQFAEETESARSLEREARRQCWDEIFKSCDRLFPGGYPLSLQLSADVERRMDELRAEAKAAGTFPAGFQYHHANELNVARYQVEWWALLREHGQMLGAELTRLVDVLDVEVMRVPMQVVRRLTDLAHEAAHDWLSPIVDTVIEVLRRDGPGLSPEQAQLNEIASWGGRAVRLLRSTADTHRAKAHDADDVNPWTEEPAWQSSREVDVTQAFQHVADLLQRLD